MITLIPEPLRDQSLQADRHRLLQVLANLVGNALKYSPTGSPVILSAWLEPETLAIAVRDRGPGIPTEELPRIFERYHRGTDGHARAPEGVGLGLYVSREIVRAHGGELTVQSQPGRGSTFVVALPIGDGKGAPPARERPGRRAASGHTTAVPAASDAR